jgi:acyl-CoA synthetase (AMP-forming)/AMP-acid ligase II
VFTGGAPVFPRTLDRLALIAPGAEITALYGSTEAEPIARLGLDEIEADDRFAMMEGHGLLAGMPTTGTNLRIIADRSGTPIPRLSREEFEAESLPPDEPGEIVVSGAHVLRGYLGRRGDAETKIVVDDGIWHRTGDAGYRDRRGRLWLLGRCSARLSCDLHIAGPIYPLAVEAAVIAANSSIRRAACVARNGWRLLVIEIERSDGEVDPKAIRRSIPWARIDEVILCPGIPVDGRHNAKIDYPALHEMLESRDASISRSKARGKTDRKMFMG